MAVSESGRTSGGVRALGTFFGAAGAVIFATSVVFSLVFRDASSWLTLGPLAGSLLAMAFWLAVSYRKLTESLSQRSGVYVVISVAMSAALLALLVGANVLLVKTPITLDLSAQGVHSLAEQTQKVLKGLTEPVRITHFYKRGSPEALKLDSLVQSYRRFTDKLTYRSFSPRRDLAEVDAYQVKEDGPKVFVEMRWDQPKEERVARFAIELTEVNHEQELTNAIMKVAQQRRPRLYVLTGHGEASPSDGNPDGYKAIVDDLIGEGYEVAPLNLVQDRRVPDDAVAVLLAGPRLSLLRPELAELSRYLSTGGAAAVLLEPHQSHGLGALLGAYGVQPGEDLVIDKSPFGSMFGGGPDTATSTDFAAEHPVTKGMAGTTAVFPRSRSISLNPGTGANHTLLVKTGLRSWGETDDIGAEEIRWNEGEVRGPVTLAVAVEKPLGEQPDAKVTRLFVVGDASFASNRYRGLGANRNLFLNAVGWLSAQEDKIAIRPRTRGANQIVLSSRQREGIAFFVLYVLPVLLLSLGLGIWLVRKQR
jgi:ABC-type uncharacterized transport system involved in gliding motility auxiliary subunit